MSDNHERDEAPLLSHPPYKNTRMISPIAARAIIQWVAITLGVIVFALRIAILAISKGKFSEQSFANAHYRSGLGVIVVIIVGVTTLLICVHFLIGSYEGHASLENPRANQVLQKARRLENLQGNKRLFYGIILFLNVLSVVFSLILFLNIPYFSWIHSFNKNDYNQGWGRVLQILEGTSIGMSFLFLMFLVVCLWWPYYMLADCLIAMFSVLQLFITVIAMLINVGSISKGPDYEYTGSKHLKVEQVYPNFAFFQACCCFLGIAVSTLAQAKTRLSNPIKNFVLYYIAVCILSAILAVPWLGMSINEAVQNGTKLPEFNDVFVANPVLAFVSIVIDLACIASACWLIAEPKTKLKVEEYDLSKLNQDELDTWAKIIDSYNNTYASPDVASGANALDLMKAYVESPMENFSCRVLRVYDEQIASHEQEKSYETVRAWDQLDDVNVLFSHDIEKTSSRSTLIDNKEKEKATEDGEPKLSKNQLKRMRLKAEKKAAKKGVKAKMDSLPPPPKKQEKSPEEIQRELNFRATVVSTEALVLLTAIDNYDLTSPLKGKLRAILSRTLGGKSRLRLLCVRFAILGTHWPFRQMIYYTSPTKKPTARSTAILTALSNWNSNLPRSQRATMILNPSYSTGRSNLAITMSGWVKTDLMPSHVLDLRPYKGKSLTEFLKAIKYRNQASTFNHADGQVIETTDFSRENCELAMHLWKNIAEKRIAEGHTAVLKDPTVDFLMSLGSRDVNTHGFRKLLFLKVEDKIIASCVLFFLGKTVTSDIQGLDHDKARQYKAYFVMMQETIKIALRDGISFVDFGPTTAKAKLDIGCSSIPLVGAIQARTPLSSLIGLFANQVNG